MESETLKRSCIYPLILVKLQEQRKEGVKRARFLALLHVTVSIVSIIVGITTVVIAKRNNTGLPVTHPMTLIAGLSVCFIGVIFLKKKDRFKKKSLFSKIKV